MKKDLENFLTVEFRALSWLIIGLGILVRINQYLYNRSLWMDEAGLALNLVDRSVQGLFKRLDHLQMAPIGFLLTQKSLVQLFGHSEYVLRIFPLTCGLVSIVLFYLLIRDIFDKKMVLIATALFSFSHRLIYFSSECKPYSSDVMIMLILCGLARYVFAHEESRLSLPLLAIAGTLVTWFSYPSLFVLAGVAICLSIPQIKRKEWMKLVRFLSVYSFWLINFCLTYIFYIKSSNHEVVYLRLWKNAFMPLSGESFGWLMRHVYIIFNYLVGFDNLTLIIIILFLIGAWSLFNEKRRYFYLFILPIIFSLLASALNQFPFSERLLLFILPTIFIFTAQGVMAIFSIIKERSFIGGLCVMVLVFFYPLKTVFTDFVYPITRQEMRPVLMYLKSHCQKGDVIFTTRSARFASQFYVNYLGFPNSTYFYSKREIRSRGAFIEDFIHFRGAKRVWVIFTSSNSFEYKTNKMFLNTIGIEKDSFTAPGVELYLYDFSK